MPFAATHTLAAMLCVDLYRKIFTNAAKYFTPYTIFVAAFAGLLPDIDIPLDLITDQFGYDLEHGTITHTPFFALLFLIPGIYFWLQKKQTIGMYFFVATFGILLHFSIDRLLSPYAISGIMLMYPFSDYAVHIGLFGTMEKMDVLELYAAIDAIVLLLWLCLLTFKHKIHSFF